MFFEIVQAVFTAGSALALLVIAGITLGGSAVVLAVSTPLFIIFSPVLVPATIATTLLATGLTATGSAGATALSILMWLYKKYMGNMGKGGPKIPGMGPKAPKSNPADSGGKTE